MTPPGRSEDEHRSAQREGTPSTPVHRDPREERSSFLLVPRDAVAPQAWRNGGGRTRELLTWPDSESWRVRVSVADIESDGPFSSFPGVQRWFTVLQGRGVELTIDGESRRLTRNDEPLHFDGAATTLCRLLDGPTLDLNLMLRGVPGRLRVAADGVEWRPVLAQCGLFTAVAGECRVGGEAIALPACSLLWFARSPGTLRFEASRRPAADAAWWLEAGEAST